MNVRYIYKWCMVVALAVPGTNLGLQKVLAVPPDPVSATDGAQVLTRGPVHEAFAETVTFDPLPGIVVPKTPPAAIEELPPEQKPAGANVAWIPGYWAWDDERSDFLWVSGIWRDLPPGRQWVPGYWGQSGQGYQWTSGYWADAQVSNVALFARAAGNRRSRSQHRSAFGGRHLAARLLDVESEPLCLASRFLGRRAAGLGVGSRPLRLDPARLRVCRRLLGLLPRPSRRAVCAGVFPWGHVCAARFFLLACDGDRPGRIHQLSLLRPQYQHYYFGDYYAANYQAAGFYPSYSYNSGRYGYDPIYRPRALAASPGRPVGAALRSRLPEPPRSRGCPPAADVGGPSSARRRWGQVRKRGAPCWPCHSPNSRRATTVRCDSSRSIRCRRQKLVQHGQAVQRFRDQRQKLENQAAAPSAAQAAKQLAPATARLPISPIVARSNAELGKDHVPPQIHVAPKPDLTVEAKPRTTPSAEKPQPRTVNRLPLDTPKPEPHVERPAPKPEPRAERPAPKPEPQVERPAPKSEPQAERPAPKPAPGRAASAEI